MGFQKTIAVFFLMIAASITCTSQMVEDNVIREIFKYGTMAPSSHNAQMWRVTKEREYLYRVDIDSLRRLSAVDPYDREAYISIGAFIQNCVYSARFYGISVSVFVKDAKAYLDFSGYREVQEADRHILSNIERRQTCRKNYSNISIPSDTIHKLCLLYGNARYIEKLSDEGKKLSELIVKSNCSQFASEKIMNELTHYISSNSDDMKSGRGLSLKSLGLNGIGRLLFRIIYAKKDFAHRKSFIAASIKTTKEQLENCSGFFILFAQSDTPDDLIRMGMELERFWIKLNSMGISVHPMSQPLEEAPDKVAEMFPDAGVPEMILRVGYCSHSHSYKKLRKKLCVSKPFE